MARTGWRFPPERRHVLRREDREAFLPPSQVLHTIDVQPNDVVVDVGAGTGYFTEALAERVKPDGRVFAVDVEPLMLDDLRGLVSEHHLDNVQVIQSGETSIPLDDDIADLVLLAFVLHEPPNPDDLLAELMRLTKPHGRLAVLEWQARETHAGPPLDHRISEEEARALMGAAGFSVEALPCADADAYLLVGTRFDEGAPQMTVPTA